MSSTRRRRKSQSPGAAPKTALVRTLGQEEHEPAIAYLAGAASEKVVDALIDEPGNWQRAPDGTLYYGNPEGTFVSVGGDPRVPAVVNADEAWNLVIQVGGDEAAQTLLYVMAQSLSSENPMEKIRITVNDSLQFRGLKKHRHRDFRPEQKRAEARRFRLLSEIWVTARDVIEVPSGKGVRRKKVNVTSRLIDIAIESEDDARAKQSGGPMRLPSIISAEGTDIPYAVRASMGEWAKSYVAAPEFVKRILHKIVRYDVNVDASLFAMRFALAIMFKRIGTQATIGELLQSARIPRPERRADRFRDNIEDAFETLTRDGLIGGWHYRVKDETLPQTRWLDRWLSWTVELTPSLALGS